MLVGKQGSPGKARDLLAPTYAWFPEGSHAPDLQERALLKDLGAAGR